MTPSELHAVTLALLWFAGGLMFGCLRWGCFGGLGIGLAAGSVGLVVGVSLVVFHDELTLRCIRLGERKPRLGSALGWAGAIGFAVVYLGLLAVPPVVLAATRR